MSQGKRFPRTKRKRYHYERSSQPFDKSRKVWYNKYRKRKGDDLMERKITSKAEFLEAIKREKERRKKVAEAQEKKLAKIEIEKKKKMTFIERGF